MAQLGCKQEEKMDSTPEKDDGLTFILTVPLQPPFVFIFCSGAEAAGSSESKGGLICQ